MKLVLVRHGESVGNTKRGFISGASDPDGLSEKGRIQAIRRAYELSTSLIPQSADSAGKPSKISIISSPVARAIETAEILARALNVKRVSRSASFAELDHGVCEGRYWWEMQEHKESFGNAQPWKEFDAPYPSGESFKMLAERVSVGIQNVIQHAYKDDVIVLVSHQAVIGALSYFFSHSFSLKDPNIFMNHLHSSHSANAGGFLIQSKNKDLYTVEPLSNLSPVSNVNDAISFYHKQRSSAKEHTISRISSVSQNAVYHVQSAHQPVLIKVLQDDHMLTGQRLVDLYRYLEKQDDIHAPRILHYDPSRVFFQDDIVIQDYVVGDTLESCIEKRIDSLAALMPQLLQSIQTIHRIPVHEVYSFWNPPRYTTWDRFLLGEIRHMYSAIRSSTVLNREANMIVARHLHTLEQYLQHQAYQSVPLHGDLGPSNIIVSLTDTAGCVPRIVDFERARIGDPLWDYVYLQGFLERIEPVVAAEWNTQVVELIDTNQQQVYDAYRTLFHVWSVWDMLELQTDIAHVRGKRSLELLHAIEVPG